MKSVRYILLLVAVIIAVPFCVGQQRTATINMKSWRAFPVYVGDSTYIALVGNVVCYHNGSVITCDSAVQYSGTKAAFYGDVLINKDNTFAYGDRATYDGTTNMARIYSPLIKMMDGDAVMYTYNFSFDTKNDIGQFWGGATITQKQTQLEADRGYFYSNTNDFMCAGAAELRDTTYMIRSDSIGYNTDTEIATFYAKTYIWNREGDILSANRGTYHSPTEHYTFADDAYILSDENELWADSIDYKSQEENAILKGNIQILDHENKMLAYGDSGRYWGAENNVMLTENPSIVSFDPEQGDSLYMRADSMWLYTLDSLSVYHSAVRNAEANAARTSRMADEQEEIIGDTREGWREDIMLPDSTAVVAPPDSLATETLPTDSLASEIVRDTLSTEIVADSLSVLPPAENVVPDTIAVAAPPDSLAVSPIPPDSLMATIPPDTLLATTSPDSLLAVVSPDSLAVTTTFADSLGVVTTIPPDSLTTQIPEEEGEKEPERVILGYRNVKIFRNDFQAVCDSLVAFSVDSTAHLYINPVMWNENNQIYSDVVDVFTKNQKIDRAFFSGGKPMMAAEIDTAHYNQVTGKTIEALFSEGEIYRVNADGNGQTYYYVQDEKTSELQSFFTAESAGISFLISERTIDYIVWRTNPVFKLFPMDMIPADNTERLEGFEWYGLRRPLSKEEVCDRIERPSQKERYRTIEQPTFPISIRIDEYKRNLMMNTRWRDRLDVLTDADKEYIRQILSGTDLQ